MDDQKCVYLEGLDVNLVGACFLRIDLGIESLLKANPWTVNFSNAWAYELSHNM